MAEECQQGPVEGIPTEELPCGTPQMTQEELKALAALVGNDPDDNAAFMEEFLGCCPTQYASAEESGDSPSQGFHSNADGEARNPNDPLVQKWINDAASDSSSQRTYIYLRDTVGVDPHDLRPPGKDGNPNTRRPNKHEGYYGNNANNPNKTPSVDEPHSAGDAEGPLKNGWGNDMIFIERGWLAQPRITTNDYALNPSFHNEVAVSKCGQTYVAYHGNVYDDTPYQSHRNDQDGDGLTDDVDTDDDGDAISDQYDPDHPKTPTSYDQLTCDRNYHFIIGDMDHSDTRMIQRGGTKPKYPASQSNPCTYFSQYLTFLEGSTDAAEISENEHFQWQGITPSREFKPAMGVTKNCWLASYNWKGAARVAFFWKLRPHLANTNKFTIWDKKGDKWEYNRWGNNTIFSQRMTVDVAEPTNIWFEKSFDSPPWPKDYARWNSPVIWHGIQRNPGSSFFFCPEEWRKKYWGYNQKIYAVIGDDGAGDISPTGAESFDNDISNYSRIRFLDIYHVDNFNGWPIVLLNKTQFETIFDQTKDANKWATAHNLNSLGEDRTSGLQDDDSAFFCFFEDSPADKSIAYWSNGRVPNIIDATAATAAYAPSHNNNGQNFQLEWSASMNWNTSTFELGGAGIAAGENLKNYLIEQAIDYQTRSWVWSPEQMSAGLSFPRYESFYTSEGVALNWISTRNDKKEISGEISGSDNKIGSSVHLTEDGQTLVYSSEWTDDPTSFSENSKGWVKVVEWNSEEERWDQIGQTLKGDSNGDHFGKHVKITGNGKYVIASAKKYAKVFKKIELEDGGFEWLQLGFNLNINEIVRIEAKRNKYYLPTEQTYNKNTGEITESLTEPKYTFEKQGFYSDSNLSRVQIESINIIEVMENDEGVSILNIPVSDDQDGYVAKLPNLNPIIMIGAPLAPTARKEVVNIDYPNLELGARNWDPFLETGEFAFTNDAFDNAALDYADSLSAQNTGGRFQCFGAVFFMDFRTDRDNAIEKDRWSQGYWELHHKASNYSSLRQGGQGSICNGTRGVSSGIKKDGSHYFNEEYPITIGYSTTTQISQSLIGSQVLMIGNYGFWARMSPGQLDDWPQNGAQLTHWDDNEINCFGSMYFRKQAVQARFFNLFLYRDFDHDGVVKNDVLPRNTDEHKDSDSDGAGDFSDPFPYDSSEWRDSDKDGVGDNSDAFPNDPNETEDADKDYWGDNADSDSSNPDVDQDSLLDGLDPDPNDPDVDSDGVLDGADAFPLDPTETLDTDNDGIGDNSDPDKDGDGVLNDADAFPLDSTETTDTDSDGVGDNADLDDDNDGLTDVQEKNLTPPSDPLDSDTDDDGILDNADLFPTDPSETKDNDSDGIGDNADTDDDNDQIPDSVEISNGTDPLNPDSDGDGSPDNLDAFPLDSTETLDTDSDGTGDNSDPDKDGDGVLNDADAFPLDSTETADTDSDGVGDNTDVFPDDPSETKDTDSDGVGDNADAFPEFALEQADSDSDGIGDNVDLFPNIDISWGGVSKLETASYLKVMSSLHLALLTNSGNEPPFIFRSVRVKKLTDDRIVLTNLILDVTVDENGFIANLEIVNPGSSFEQGETLRLGWEFDVLNHNGVVQTYTTKWDPGVYIKPVTVFQPIKKLIAEVPENPRAATAEGIPAGAITACSINLPPHPYSYVARTGQYDNVPTKLSGPDDSRVMPKFNITVDGYNQIVRAVVTYHGYKLEANQVIYINQYDIGWPLRDPGDYWRGWRIPVTINAVFDTDITAIFEDGQKGKDKKFGGILSATIDGFPIYNGTEGQYDITASGGTTSEIGPVDLTGEDPLNGRDPRDEGYMESDPAVFTIVINSEGSMSDFIIKNCGAGYYDGQTIKLTSSIGRTNGYESTYNVIINSANRYPMDKLSASFSGNSTQEDNLYGILSVTTRSYLGSETVKIGNEGQYKNVTTGNSNSPSSAKFDVTVNSEGVVTDLILKDPGYNYNSTGQIVTIYSNNLGLSTTSRYLRLEINSLRRFDSLSATFQDGEVGKDKKFGGLLTVSTTTNLKVAGVAGQYDGLSAVGGTSWYDDSLYEVDHGLSMGNVPIWSFKDGVSDIGNLGPDLVNGPDPRDLGVQEYDPAVFNVTIDSEGNVSNLVLVDCGAGYYPNQMIAIRSNFGTDTEREIRMSTGSVNRYEMDKLSATWGPDELREFSEKEFYNIDP